MFCALEDAKDLELEQHLIKKLGVAQGGADKVVAKGVADNVDADKVVAQGVADNVGADKVVAQGVADNVCADNVVSQCI